MNAELFVDMLKLKAVQEVRHPALDAGSPILKKAGDTGSKSGMTLLKIKLPTNRPSWSALTIFYF